MSVDGKQPTHATGASPPSPDAASGDFAAAERLQAEEKVLGQRGWIKLWRHFMSHEHPLWAEKRPRTKWEAFIDMVALARHGGPTEVLLGGEFVTCSRGQLVLSVGSLAERWQWSPSKVRRFLKLQEQANEIRRENVKKSTRITLLKYELYCGERRDHDAIVTRSRHTNKNGKQCKRNKSYDISGDEKTKLLLQKTAERIR